MSKVQEQWLGLDELSLVLGQDMLLYPDPADKTRFHVCHLAGYLPGEALLLTPDVVANSPTVTEGQRVVVRVNLSHGIALFPAAVMFSIRAPRLLVYLAFPQTVKFRRVRGALRVNVTLPILAGNLDRIIVSGVPGKITDLSETGTRLVMFRTLARVGERVHLKGKFEVGGVIRTLTVQGVVRTARGPGDCGPGHPSAQGNGQAAPATGEFSYGVEFCEATDDQRLVLSHFIFHAMAFGRVQVIH